MRLVTPICCLALLVLSACSGSSTHTNGGAKRCLYTVYNGGLPYICTTYCSVYTTCKQYAITPRPMPCLTTVAGTPGPVTEFVSQAICDPGCSPRFTGTIVRLPPGSFPAYLLQYP
jgi:hypothetical protein